MRDSEARDPLIRALLIIIIGTIAFGLLFNLFTGGGTMEHMGTNTGTMTSYTLDGFLAGLLMLLVKLLMVALVLAVIIGIVMWIKNNFFKNTDSQFLQTIKNDPIIKTVTAITIAILGIILVMSLIGSFNGQGMMGYGYSSGAMMGGYYGAFSMYGLLSLLIKILSFVLVISLILALLAYLKKQYEVGYFNSLKSGNAGNSQKSDPNDIKDGENSV